MDEKKTTNNPLYGFFVAICLFGGSAILSNLTSNIMVIIFGDVLIVAIAAFIGTKLFSK